MVVWGGPLAELPFWEEEGATGKWLREGSHREGTPSVLASLAQLCLWVAVGISYSSVCTLTRLRESPAEADPASWSRSRKGFLWLILTAPAYLALRVQPHGQGRQTRMLPSSWMRRQWLKEVGMTQRLPQDSRPQSRQLSPVGGVTGTAWQLQTLKETQTLHCIVYTKVTLPLNRSRNLYWMSERETLGKSPEESIG